MIMCICYAHMIKVVVVGTLLRDILPHTVMSVDVWGCVFHANVIVTVAMLVFLSNSQPYVSAFLTVNHRLLRLANKFS
jgi:hypothetical protein